MIEPTKKQLEALLSYPADQEVVMINLLKFKPRVDGSTESGEEAYKRYMMKTAPHLKKVGGRLLWKGTVTHVVIGDGDFKPDTILLVAYPSVQKFLEMVTNPDYLDIARDRSIALEFGGLLASCTEFSSFAAI